MRRGRKVPVTVTGIQQPEGPPAAGRFGPSGRAGGPARGRCQFTVTGSRGPGLSLSHAGPGGPRPQFHRLGRGDSHSASKPASARALHVTGSDSGSLCHGQSARGGTH